MSYGTNHGAQWQRGAEIVDLILKGAKPADIPVEQPTKFELVINLKTAKTARSHLSAGLTCHCRRGDRIAILLLRCTWSENGPVAEIAEAPT
jgi:hypothetical protein